MDKNKHIEYDKFGCPIYILNDGNKMPMIGLGTDHLVESKAGSIDAIKFAVKCGYRHFDTAPLYDNEQLLGVALRQCIDEGLVKREELFVVTKVWNTYHKRKSVIESCRQSLARLQLNYVDLLLIHWPMAFEENIENGGNTDLCPIDLATNKIKYSSVTIEETWLGMEDVKDAKLSKSIGVSNFNHIQIDKILSCCKHKPVVNQVECHPYLNQQLLLEYSIKNNILLTAHCSLGSLNSCGKDKKDIVLVEDELIKSLANKYSKNVGQILLKFSLQRNISVIPKSGNFDRIRGNFELNDFKLDDADMEKLMKLNRNFRYCPTTRVEPYIPRDHPEYPFTVEY